MPALGRQGVNTSGSAAANVVSIAKRGAHRLDFRSIASQRLRTAREKLGQDRASFAALLTGMLGWGVAETTLARWERGATPPGDVLLAAVTAEEGGLLAPAGSLLQPVPSGFPASALEGPWVTCYQFSHGGTLLHHADIAHVTAESDWQIRAANYPPAPRTEGRAQPFRNEIEAQLASRHLIGHWRNTSDTRYFGAVHLAVLPGEMVMEGHYTGFASDIAVSMASWKWVRLLEQDGLAGVTLREPAAVYDLVMNHLETDAPLTLADIGEEA